MTREDGEGAALELLGLARRAGALEVGVDAAGRAVRRGKAKLLVTATDASPTQIDKVRPMAERRGVAVRLLGTRDRLGAATGGPPASAVAVTDDGLAEQLLRRIPGPEGAGGKPK